MNPQPLLTVIVPSYNVEKYVDKCISSIVGQTYPNLEILLIDDGSTDNTGMLCDTWQERDSRIRVIHKQNEGLPYARKTGIENSTAEYVTFVDSDDWIDTNMYADMMTALLSTNSDIADCDMCLVYDDGRMEHRVNERHTTIKTMGRVESVIMVLEDHGWRTSFGTKIFKKTLFEHIQFPKRRLYGEDTIVHDLFHQTSQTVLLNSEYYFYYQRDDSATKVRNIRKEMKNYSDFSDAYYERYCFVKQHPEYHSALPFIEHKTICLCLGLLRNMMAYPQYFTDEYFKVKVEQLRSIPLTHNDKLRTVLKYEMYMIKMSPKLYKILRSVYVRIIHGANKLKITKRQTSNQMYTAFWKW
jgi:glycosyltransferase involved in cell wall biosynthesis